MSSDPTTAYDWYSAQLRALGIHISFHLSRIIWTFVNRSIESTSCSCLLTFYLWAVPSGNSDFSNASLLTAVVHLLPLWKRACICHLVPESHFSWPIVWHTGRDICQESFSCATLVAQVGSGFSSFRKFGVWFLNYRNIWPGCGKSGTGKVWTSAVKNPLCSVTISLQAGWTSSHSFSDYSPKTDFLNSPVSMFSNQTRSCVGPSVHHRHWGSEIWFCYLLVRQNVCCNFLTWSSLNVGFCHRFHCLVNGFTFYLKTAAEYSLILLNSRSDLGVCLQTC